MKPSVFVVASLAAIAGQAHAYEISTHAEIMQHAFEVSSAPEVVKQLGITSKWTLNTDEVRRARFNDGTAVGWMREGAVLEDGSFGCDSRPSNHFYNPIDGSGYSYHGFGGNPSPSWGLEDLGQISGQDFSYEDAKAHFWAALKPDDDEDRERELALTFRALGHVTHLVQDAAQPQHTRNDSHAGWKSCPATLGLFGPASAYEVYVDSIHSQATYSGYPNVSFHHPRDYWDDEAGRGLAEFSNRSFVTVGTNFTGFDPLAPAPGFPEPNGAGATENVEDIQSLMPGTSLHGWMTFISTPFYDAYTQTTGVNPRTSTYSIFTENLKRALKTPRFTLNRFNYDAMHALLLPRAVGYSAGLIDHFFRGRIEIAAPDAFVYAAAPYADGKASFSALTMKIRNATVGEETGYGTVEAILRYRGDSGVNPLLFPAYSSGGVRYAVSAPQSLDLGRELQEVRFDFSATPIPVLISDVSLIVVYRGPLGSMEATEADAIVFGGKDLYEPSLITVGNSMDYDCHRSVLYDTVGITAAARDVDHDGVQDLFGPWTLRQDYVRLLSLNGPHVEPSALDFTFRTSLWDFAQASRFVALQDRSYFAINLAADDAFEPSTGGTVRLLQRGEMFASINRFTNDNGELIHEVSDIAARYFRNLLTMDGALWATGPVTRDSTCASALASVPRSLTETSGETR